MMAAILEPIDENSADPDVANVFKELRKNAPGIPALFSTLAHAPHLLKGWTQFAWPMRTLSSSPRSMRELAILRVLQLAGAHNEFEYHKGMGLNAGLRGAQVDALGAWRDSDAYSTRERAVLAVAEEIAMGPAASEDSMKTLKEHFSNGEVVELVLTACFYVLVSRFTESMRLDRDDPAIVTAISSKV